MKKKNFGQSSLDRYLREIGQTPLISPDEEVELAKRIHQGDQEALEKLTKANLRFVVSVAKQYQNQGLSLADLINEGNIGLIEAAKRFNESRGFKFISYAVWWIRQAILAALGNQSRIVRLPLSRVGILHKIGKVSSALEQEFDRKPTPEEVAEVLEISEKDVKETLESVPIDLSLDQPFGDDGDSTFQDVFEDESQPAPDQNLLEESMRLEIEKALDGLSAREAEVVGLYFGINRDRALTLEEIGARFNLTRERIRQIKEKAIRRLRTSHRSKGLRYLLGS